MKKQKNVRAEKRGERGEAIRAYFVRLFGKYDFRNEAHFLYFGKWCIYILLLLVEALILLQYVDGFTKNGGWVKFTWLLGIVVLLSVCMAIQLFAMKKLRQKIACYVIDMIAACGFLFFTGGVYPLLVYMLILTQVYFEAERTKHSVFLLILSIILYVAAYGIQLYVQHGASEWNLLQLLSLSFGFVFGITAHFLGVQIALAFYRQYLKLDRTLRELNESQRELEKAYAVVAEVTVLEERQRIAKDIHDTAGHSLTTVIMQTEMAKRIIDDNPKEAKNKLIAANLQAKHALEELRDSVHLLSGGSENVSLKDALLGIVHESTDGTGIKIRSEIAEISVLPAKYRFLCSTLKEGISNGLRHGGATAFWFELKEEDGEISFLLSDNGRGRAGDAIRLGFGLTTMQQRASALGGEVQFFSDIEEGFEILLKLPSDGRQGGDSYDREKD